MSSDDQRIGVDDLLAHAEPVPVDSLDISLHAPWSRDVGLASLRSAVYGVDIILTHRDKVVFGHDAVVAEQMQPEDGGRVLAIDTAKLGWTETRTKGWALAKFNPHRLASVAKPVMAEWSIEVFQEDPDLAAAAGFDGDDIDAMLQAIDDEDAEVLGAASEGDGGFECPNCGVVVPSGG